MQDNLLLPRGLVMLIAAAWLAFGPTATARAEEEAWWGRDKALHLSVSAALSLGSYAIAVPLAETRPVRIAWAAGIGLGFGVGKELADWAGLGTPSWKDFCWDVVGVALGTLLAWTLDLLLSPRPTTSTARSSLDDFADWGAIRQRSALDHQLLHGP